VIETRHGHADPLTSPAFAHIRALAWRRSRYAVATLPACVRRALRVQRVGWERRMVARRRAGLGASGAYHLNTAQWGRR
jgi:hypothetical protein